MWVSPSHRHPTGPEPSEKEEEKGHSVNSQPPALVAMPSLLWWSVHPGTVNINNPFLS